MSRFVSVFALCFGFIAFVSGQITERDGIFFDKNDNPYSGVYIEYYASGGKKVETTISNGVKNGVTTLFFEDGVINEVRYYKNNQMDGTWLTFDHNGIKTAEARYDAGIKEGKWFIWDEKGTLRYEMLYSKGNKAGVWKIWDESGKLVAEKTY